MNERTEIEKMMHEHRGGDGVLAIVTEMIKVALISLAIILPVRYFLVQPFYVNGASMEPNFYDHEYLIIDEISYRFNVPERGEVIVFRYPQDPDQYFIKRIIGLPGERVIIREGTVFIQKRGYDEPLKLKEPYLPIGTLTFGTNDVTLGDDEYFVLGDNRGGSLDSRRFGPIVSQEIVGRTWLRGWPLEQAGILEHYEFDF